MSLSGFSWTGGWPRGSGRVTPTTYQHKLKVALFIRGFCFFLASLELTDSKGFVGLR